MQDFNCALQENILLQGHMYLFLHHICFYSNIFGYETKKTIPLQDVTDVRKAKTAAIFPNAIEIVAGPKRHFFGSFLARDDAFRVIVDGWEQHVSDARLLIERQDAKSASSSDENGYVLLDEGNESKQDDDSTPLNRSPSPTAVVGGNTDSGDSDMNTSKRFLEVPEDGNVEKATSLSPFSLEPFDDNAPNVPESYTLIAESKFQVPVEVLFNLLFADGALGFLDDLHKNCGDKEFSCSKWRLDEQGGIVRDVSFLHPIKIYLGAKYGTCQEVQKLRRYKNSHLVIQTSQEIGDAPYGDHFIVEGIWDVEQDSLDENSCHLRIYINVAFSKRTIFRGKIEQSTKDECREVFGLWIKLGHDLLKQDSSSRLKEASTSTNTDVQSEPTLNVENPLESTVAHMASTPHDSGLSTLVPPVEHRQSIERGSLASTSQGLWGSIVSYMRSSQSGPVLAVLLVVIIILMQVITIVVVSRSPKVLMVSPEASASSFGSYSKESIEWVQKRVSLLSEEMQMAESHMDKMRHEFAWLKSHLERLERLRSSS